MDAGRESRITFAPREGKPGQRRVRSSIRRNAMSEYVSDLMAEVKAKNPAEPEFHQAV